MTKKWIGTKPERCQVCGDAFRDMFFDARVGGHRGTGWALICGDCFNAYQCLLGTGLGQAYNLETLERIEVPNLREAKQPMRHCHGCGRDLDPHAPERVVYCGRCGDDDE